jgi:hypothetical protein
MQRLEDRVLAVRERRRAKDAESIDRVRQLGCQVWKARAASGAAQRYRRLEPTESTLREALEAQRLRSEAERVLLDECLGDRDLYEAILHETRP